MIISVFEDECLMRTGLNTEIDYQGRTYHIQTEDGGSQHPAITTQVFLKGAILATKKTSYTELINSENLETMVRDLMIKQHKAAMHELRSGTLLKKGPEQTPAPRDKPTPKPTSTSAADHPKPQGKLDDFIIDYAVGEEEKDKG
jgi:hypothetical protein